MVNWIPVCTRFCILWNWMADVLIWTVLSVHQNQIQLHFRGNPVQVLSIPAGVPWHIFPFPPASCGFHGIPAIPIPVQVSSHYWWWWWWWWNVVLGPSMTSPHHSSVLSQRMSPGRTMRQFIKVTAWHWLIVANNCLYRVCLDCESYLLALISTGGLCFISLTTCK